MKKQILLTVVMLLASQWLLAQKFQGGSYDGSASVSSGVITLVGSPTSYTYTNPRFFGGSYDGFSSVASDTLTLNGASTAFIYSNPRFFGGSFSGASTVRGDSIFTLDVEEKTPSVRIPKDYALAQNYPNPFNTTTMIQYDLPFASAVRLELFDMLGRKVATLINTTQSAGTHAYTLRASDFALSSGIYFYRLQAGEYVHTRKMVLVK